MWYLLNAVWARSRRFWIGIEGWLETWCHWICFCVVSFHLPQLSLWLYHLVSRYRYDGVISHCGILIQVLKRSIQSLSFLKDSNHWCSLPWASLKLFGGLAILFDGSLTLYFLGWSSRNIVSTKVFMKPFLDGWMLSAIYCILLACIHPSTSCTVE